MFTGDMHKNWARGQLGSISWCWYR